MATEAALRWRPPPRIASPLLRWALWAVVAAYAALSLTTLDVDTARMAEGFSRAGAFFGGWLHPDFVTRWSDIRIGLLESLAMAAAATFGGVLLAVPLGLAAARNLAPLPVYAAARGLLAVSRAFHEIIVAIFFVAMFGFGPFAGTVTLVVGSI